MYCPSCGSEITVELNYCNRCGANLTVPTTSASSGPPVRLTGPSIVLALTVVGALAIIFGGATDLLAKGLPPFAIAWIVIFSLATLFGCTALMIRFWSMIIRTHRPSLPAPKQRNNEQAIPQQQMPQLPPRYETGSSVTENTTRTFAPIYREPRDR